MTGVRSRHQRTIHHLPASFDLRPFIRVGTPRGLTGRVVDRLREIDIHGHLKALALGSALLLALAAGSASASASSSKSNAVAPVSSFAQLEAVLATSIKQTQLPADLVPSLEQLSNVQEVQGSAYLHASCDPYVYNSEASDPAPCWYGSMTSTKTVVIFGDSFVGNWIPALDLAGKSMDFRVAEFSFPGCLTPFVTMTGSSPDFDASEVKACNEFHQNLPRVVNALAPEAVIAANGTPSWGPAGNPSFVSNLGKAFDEMTTTTSHPIRILLGTGPHLLEPAPSCLATHPGNINLCNFHYGPSSAFAAALQRDSDTIAADQLHLIPTYPWLCLDGVCPAVIGHVDVYADADHMTIAMSKYLAVLLEQALAPLLSGPAS